MTLESERSGREDAAFHALGSVCFIRFRILSNQLTIDACLDGLALYNDVVIEPFVILMIKKTNREISIDTVY